MKRHVLDSLVEQVVQEKKSSEEKSKSRYEYIGQRNAENAEILANLKAAIRLLADELENAEIYHNSHVLRLRNLKTKLELSEMVLRKRFTSEANGKGE